MGLDIIDSGQEGSADELVSRLAEYGYTGRMTTFSSVRDLKSAHPDILLVMPGADIGADNPVACGVLLLPGDADIPPGACDAGCVVTYGMSPKNTVTYSSIGEDACVVALQRELVTVGRDVLERQEIKIGGGMRPDLLLAAASAALVLGLPVEMKA